MARKAEEGIWQFQEPALLKRLRVAWLAEAIAAGPCILLSIIALAGIFPAMFAAIAAISLGTALLFEAVGLAACFSDIAETHRRQGESLEWGGATAGKLFAGAGGILISLLVLCGLSSPALLPVGVLIFGAAFLFTSMISCVPNTQEIIGAVAFILGLLAIGGLHSLTLVLVALLVLGLTTLFNDVSGERRIRLQIVAGRA